MDEEIPLKHPSSSGITTSIGLRVLVNSGLDHFRLMDKFFCCLLLGSEKRWTLHKKGGRYVRHGERQVGSKHEVLNGLEAGTGQ
ncbi:hypothetical protein SO802_018256 [Lithocarpus litseifolius]|uniref:Uncharacterized protein n=1 Tax=Lithocarpus litseifolius TaxID=425828 RepID=A0AAW2CLH9_9ROSI